MTNINKNEQNNARSTQTKPEQQHGQTGDKNREANAPGDQNDKRPSEQASGAKK